MYLSTVKLLSYFQNSETKLVELKAPFKKPVAAQETGKRRLDQKSLLSGIVVKKKKV